MPLHRTENLTDLLYKCILVLGILYILHNVLGDKPHLD